MSSAIKKRWDLAICGNNMDGPIGSYAKWSKLENDKYLMSSLIYGV